jgi:hypothetical protein
VWCQWSPDPNILAQTRKGLNGLRFGRIPAVFDGRVGVGWRNLMSRGRYDDAVRRIKSIRAALNGHVVAG